MAKSHPEDDAQKAVIRWMTYQFPVEQAFIFHPPNGGKRSVVEAGIFKSMGVKPGVPDLILLYPVGKYHGMVVEMKAPPPKKSSVTENQKAWLKRLAEKGYYAVVCKGFDAAKFEITKYLKGGA